MLPQTVQYRQRNQQLRARTLRDLQSIWPALDGNDLDRTYPGWVKVAAAIVGRDRGSAALLASEYLAAFPRAIQALPPIPLPAAQFDASMRINSVVSVKKGMLAGKTVAQAMADAFVLSAGAATRLVLNAGREAVMNSAVADPVCQGWQRVTAGGCSFCLMLASRGEVYSESSADFASHSHCMCSAEPVFDDDSTGRAKQVAEYRKSARNIPQADKDRARDWMRVNL